MKAMIWASSTVGNWAAALTLLFLVATPLKLWLRLPLPSPVLAVIGFIAFILGLIAIFKYKDRSIFMFLSILVGLLVITVTTLEVMFPH
jgi:hypothetical protein